MKDQFESVKIGNQIWMTKNLDVERFQNRELIPEVKENKEWKDAGNYEQPAWCYYETESRNGKIYGKLYNWYAVNDPRGLAPEGWHIPSAEEWDQLINFLGGLEEAEGKMKSTGTPYWANPNSAATNESGFSGLPGGYRDSSGLFKILGKYGFWWSSSEYDTLDAWSCYLNYSVNHAMWKCGTKYNGYSVRCLRD